MLLCAIKCNYNDKHTTIPGNPKIVKFAYRERERVSKQVSKRDIY